MQQNEVILALIDRKRKGIFCMDAILKFFEQIFAMIMSFFMIFNPPAEPHDTFFDPVTVNGITQTGVVKIEKNGGCRIVEGGCTDGKYIYVSLLNPKPEDDPASVILKINPADGSTVAKSGLLHIDHANDMTYNSSTGEIVICNNIPRRKLITFLDPAALEIKRTIETATEIFSIEYMPEEDFYYCGIASTYDYAKFTKDFELTEKYTGIDNGCVRQSMTHRGTDTYHLYYKTNCIYRYDASGKCTGTMTPPIQQNEAENLFFIGDVFYVVYNFLGEDNGGAVYKVENPAFNQLTTAA